MDGVFRLWVYLAASPLLWLCVTLGVYVLADTLSARLGRAPLANPVLLSILMLVLLLLGTGTSYGTYFEGAQFIHFMLGPATVALAVPLYTEARRVRRLLLPVAGALLAGSVTAIVSAMALAWALGATPSIVASLAPKSVTTPVAMAIAERNGGIPSLTAAMVVLTGIVGSVSVTPIVGLLGIRSDAASGFAAGLSSHGIGTARAFQVSELAGTFAGLALALNALATSLLVPLALRLLR